MYFVYTLKRTMSPSRIVQVRYMDVRLDFQEMEAEALETVMWEVSVLSFSIESVCKKLIISFFNLENSIFIYSNFSRKYLEKTILRNLERINS